MLARTKVPKPGCKLKLEARLSRRKSVVAGCGSLLFVNKYDFQKLRDISQKKKDRKRDRKRDRERKIEKERKRETAERERTFERDRSILRARVRCIPLFPLSVRPIRRDGSVFRTAIIAGRC